MRAKLLFSCSVCKKLDIIFWFSSLTLGALQCSKYMLLVYYITIKLKLIPDPLGPGVSISTHKSKLPTRPITEMNTSTLVQILVVLYRALI